MHMSLSKYLATAALAAVFAHMAQAEEPLKLEITEPYSTTLHCVKQTLSETFGIDPGTLGERRGYDRTRSEKSLDPDATIVSTGDISTRDDPKVGRIEIVLSDTGKLANIYYKSVVGARINGETRIPWQTYIATPENRQGFLDLDRRLKECVSLLG